MKQKFLGVLPLSLMSQGRWGTLRLFHFSANKCKIIRILAKALSHLELVEMPSQIAALTSANHRAFQAIQQLCNKLVLFSSSNSCHGGKVVWSISRSVREAFVPFVLPFPQSAALQEVGLSPGHSAYP